MKYRIPLAYDSFGAQEKKAAEEVLSSGYYTQGKRVAEFERKFAAYLGVEHAIMVNSGSSANLIAVTAAYYAAMWDEDLTNGPIGPGDDVVIPALCWPTTLTPLINLGLRPVFCDIDPNSLNLTVETVDRVLTEKTRAVVAIPILGNPEGLAELRDYCQAKRLVLLEDSCESLGAEGAGGEKVGSFGLAASFSFYFSHHISTIEGGCIATDSLLLAELCRALRSHGWTRDLGETALARSMPTFDDVDDRFCFFLPGYNVRATEIAAALGTVQLGKLPELLARRQSIARKRLEAVEPFRDRVQIPGANNRAGHSWMAFPLILNSRQERDRVRQSLEEGGIETRPIVAGNILRHPLSRFLSAPSDGVELGVCDATFDRGLMLGLNPQSSDDDEDYFCEVLRSTLKGGGGLKFP